MIAEKSPEKVAIRGAKIWPHGTPHGSVAGVSQSQNEAHGAAERS